MIWAAGIGFFPAKRKSSKSINVANGLYFFEDQTFAQQICKAAIESGACYECKCTNMEEQMVDTGVICFYLNGDDIANHIRVIRFMLDHDLIRKTKTGRYYNNSFKFDDQTRAGEYGADFEGKIKLSEFINLDTGEFIRKEDNANG